MVRHQVGGQAQRATNLARRHVAEGQSIDDRQPHGITERGVHLGPPLAQ
jgi:hypothetical protein